jgi:hypothetical protein
MPAIRLEKSDLLESEPMVCFILMPEKKHNMMHNDNVHKETKSKIFYQLAQF